MSFGHSGKSGNFGGKGGDFGKGYGKGMGKGSKGKGKGFRENFEGNRYQRFNNMGKGTGFEDRGGFGSMGGGKGEGGYSGEQYGSSGGNYEGGYSGHSGEQYGGRRNPSGLDRNEVRRRMSAIDRSKYQGFMRAMSPQERKELIEMCCEAGKCKEILGRPQSMTDISRIIELMGPCSRMAWDGFDFKDWTHYRQTMDFCAWMAGEMKEDKWDEFFVYIRKNLYRWGGPRLIHEAGGIVNFILGGGMKNLLLDEMSGDYGNRMFCGGSSIMEELLMKRLETQEDGKGETKTMGDAFSEIGSSLSASINLPATMLSEFGDGKDVSNSKRDSTDSMAGSGCGEAFTPNDQVKVTKDDLMARMTKLQADFKRLEEEELNESPAAAVKKRKRRKSAGKSADE